MVLSVMTGLRLGEICALKWEDVDFERGVALVDESLEETKEHGLRFKTPKNGKASTVVLPSLAVDFLQRHARAQEEQRRLLGDGYQNHDLIFPADDGTPRNPDAVSRQFRRFILTTDLPRIRFHDLRHTCASLMIDNETNPKVIQEQLRHSSISTTMDIYGHLMPGMQSEAMGRVDERIRKAMENDNVTKRALAPPCLRQAPNKAQPEKGL
jgi:integrase